MNMFSFKRFCVPSPSSELCSKGAATSKPVHVFNSPTLPSQLLSPINVQRFGKSRAIIHMFAVALIRLKKMPF